MIEDKYIKNLNKSDNSKITKDPKTCNNSIDFEGIYICRLHLLPCSRCRVLHMNRPTDEEILENIDGGQLIIIIYLNQLICGVKLFYQLRRTTTNDI